MASEQQESFPDTIAGFRILRRLATGGTSDVLLAESTAPRGAERVVVLKLLLARYKNDPKFERMFAREATAYARLNHPSIVKLYDFFSTDGRHGSELVMVLEFVDGVPLNRLRAWLAARAEPLDDRAAVFLAACVFAALASAHAAPDPDTGEIAPVIHRDINPSNVLLPWDGYVKLTDFGIAKVTGLTGDTKVGRIKGTFGYMAPEQVRGEATSTRTDVYATSLMLWELLARRRAIQSQALSELETLRAMAHPSLVPLDVLRPELPAELRALVARGLEPDPAKRELTADEAAATLLALVPAEEGRAVLASTLARLRGNGEAGEETLPKSSSFAPPTVPEPPLSESDFAETGVAVSPHHSPPPGQRPLPRFPTEPDAAESAPPPPPARPAPRPPSQAPKGPPQAPRPAANAPRPAHSVTARTLAFGDKLPAPAPAVPPGRVPAMVESAPALPVLPDDLSPDTVPHAPPVTLPLPPPVLTPAPVPAAPGPTITEPMAPPVVAYVPRTQHATAVSALAATAPSFQHAAGTPPAPVASPAAVPAAPAEPGRPIWYAPSPVQPSTPPPPPAGFRQSLLTMSGMEDRSGRAWAIGAFAIVFLAVLAVGGVILARGHTSSSDAVPTASGSVSVVRMQPPPPRPPLNVAPVASSAPKPVATASSSPPPTPPQPPPAAPAAGNDDSGQVHVGSAAAGHRVFIDGRVAGEGPGNYRVKCGPHSVRIGSSGKPHSVDVPCGGSATVP